MFGLKDNKAKYTLYEKKFVKVTFTPIIYLRNGGEMIDPETNGTVTKTLAWNYKTPKGYSAVTEEWFIQRELKYKPKESGIFCRGEVSVRKAVYKLYGFQVDQMCLLGSYPEDWKDFWKQRGLYYGVDSDLNNKLGLNNV